MTTIGYAAMLEQFHPTELLDWCAQAEDAGFEAGFMVSEHFHPWTPQQGQSAFAWTVHGRARRSARRCASGRVSPARPSATTRRWSPRPRPRSGRCIRTGSGWVLARARRSTSTSSAASGRRSAIRSAMMFEAIEIIKKLFTGEVVRHKGAHFTLESAKLYTLPERPRADLRRDGRPAQRQADRTFADGMITVGAADAKLQELWENHDLGAREARQGSRRTRRRSCSCT